MAFIFKVLNLKWGSNLVLICLFMMSCQVKKPLPLAGTWQLISGTVTEKGKTTVTDYTQNRSFIKIINATHFAFLNHALKNGRDSAAFDAGGGRYLLKDSLYTEHLEYYTAKEWENHDFTFTISIRNDTLIQRGIEKIENTGINRLNVEKYVRLK